MIATRGLACRYMFWSRGAINTYNVNSKWNMLEVKKQSRSVYNC